MKLTDHLSGDRREHVEGRLRSNLIAWLTTVSPAGRPESVPVWFLLREDDGEARETPEVGPADTEPHYRAKYAERIGALFGEAERFGAMFSVPLLITPRRLRA